MSILLGSLGIEHYLSASNTTVSTYLGRVLININVNNSSMFVALLDDIILDLIGPAGIVFSEKQVWSCLIVGL